MWLQVAELIPGCTYDTCPRGRALLYYQHKENQYQRQANKHSVCPLKSQVSLLPASFFPLHTLTYWVLMQSQLEFQIKRWNHVTNREACNFKVHFVMIKPQPFFHFDFHIGLGGLEKPLFQSSAHFLCNKLCFFSSLPLLVGWHSSTS